MPNSQPNHEFSIEFRVGAGGYSLWRNLLQHLGIYDEPLKHAQLSAKIAVVDQQLFNYGGYLVEANSVRVVLAFDSHEGMTQFQLAYA